MSLKKKFIFNTAIISASKVIESIISFLIVILISRELGSVGLGQYSFVFSFVGLFFIFSDWGLSTMMIKDLSKDFSKVNKYVSNILSLQLILTSLSFLIYFITLFFIGQSELFWTLVIVGAIQFVIIISTMGYCILTIKTQGLKLSIISLTERIIALIGAFFVLTFYKSLFLFILVLLLSAIIRAIVTYLFSMKYFKFRISLNLKFLWSLMKKGFPFVLILTFGLVYARIDTVMLGFMKSYQVVGWYNAGYKLIDVLTIIPTLLLTFGFPMLSKLFSKDKKNAKFLFENMLYYSLIIVLPISVGIYFVGDRILEFVYGFGSIESFYAFRILGIALIFIYLSTIMGYMIASADKQKIFAWIGGIGALINIILNIILIPKYSLYGAAIATLITYFIMGVLMYFYIRKEFFKFKVRFISSLVGVIVMGLILIRILHLHLFWIIGISGVVYGLIILLSNTKLYKYVLKKNSI
jgi:O-antigen/teichoic acid export membrane protein